MFRGIENKLGLPHIEEMKKTLDTVNTLVQSLDKEKLRMVQHLADTILRIQQTGGPNGVGQFASIIQIIAQTPNDRLNTISKVTEDIRGTVEAFQKLVKGLPPGMLENIKIGDIANEIKKEMGKSNR
ncbi:MAG: hypothetical protein PHN57_07865 [Candidatus Omnitrophica bacterium]|nr:hypothetical protein [Candidatus Omnitrophota bacterium]